MAKKISPTLVQEAIIAEAKVIKKKKEIYSQLLTLNEEIKGLYEQGMIGTFGFAANPNDRIHTTKTGFKNDFQELSHVARLAAEFEEADNKEKSLKEENEQLRQELEKLKNKLEESKTEKEDSNK